MSYGGPGAVARGQLAREIVLKRLKLTGVVCDEIRAELIGVNALHGSDLGKRAEGEPWEVRLRVAARCVDKDDAVRIGNEVETLYTNGPYGGGGASKSVRQVVAVASLFLPRDEISLQVQMEDLT
ncbi:hypothetical protein D3C73_1111510 [compost metagenome]